MVKVAGGSCNDFRQFDLVDRDWVVLDQLRKVLLALGLRVFGPEACDEIVTDLVECGCVGLADIENLEDVPAP